MAFGVFLLVLGAAGGAMYVSHRMANATQGFKVLAENHDVLAQLLAFGDQPMANDYCFGDNERQDLVVADFLGAYFWYFSEADPRKSAAFWCGDQHPEFLDYCVLSYSMRNVEDDKGVSNHLRFWIDPQSGLIDPESFVCSAY